jgi:hypothetical protein
LEGERFLAQLGRYPRRENAVVYPGVIASVSEAIHFYRLVDAWIASLTLAMTVERRLEPWLFEI